MNTAQPVPPSRQPSVAAIRVQLEALSEPDYAAFQQKLLPGVGGILGVRTPALRRLAKTLHGTAEEAAFLKALPHDTFDENQLHAFLIAVEKDFDRCLALLEQFLPHINNWATCDQLSPKVFKKHRADLLPRIERWLADGREYIVRFAIGMLMQHYLDEDFDPACPAMVAAADSEIYYIHMEVAWYFATALAKQWDAALPYLTDHRLSTKTHNKTIQKARESYRITPEQKEYLKTLKR